MHKISISKVFKVLKSIFLFAFLLVFFVFILQPIYTEYIKKYEISSFYGYSRLVIKGGSMSGMQEWSKNYTNHINLGDIVITKSIKDDSELKVGDIVTYISYSDFNNAFNKLNQNKKYEIITHRIRYIYKDDYGVITYRTQGDANKVSESYTITKKDIIGKVTYVIPKVGYVNIYVNKFINYSKETIIPNLSDHASSNKPLVISGVIIIWILLILWIITSQRKQMKMCVKNKT